MSALFSWPTVTWGMKVPSGSGGVVESGLISRKPDWPAG
jgi:hypothetical protein